MSDRVTEKQLDEIESIANACIEDSGFQVRVGYRYNYAAIDLYKQQGDGKYGCQTMLDCGLTKGQAATWLRAFIQGCQYGKMTPKWKWEAKK